MSWSRDTSLELLAMQVAVSSLSPVSIQTWNKQRGVVVRKNTLRPVHLSDSNERQSGVVIRLSTPEANSQKGAPNYT